MSVFRNTKSKAVCEDNTHTHTHALLDVSAVCSSPSPPFSPPLPSPSALGQELCLIISKSPQPTAQGRAQGRRWRFLMYE